MNLETPKDPNVLRFSENWNAEKVRSFAKENFGTGNLCVIANREPVVHTKHGERIETSYPPSGVVSALEPIVKACSGVWIGHGSGTGDRETADARGMVGVPPEDPQYQLKRVWLTPEEEQGYYTGFSNEALWPLCHLAHTPPVFRRSDWTYYQQVNAKFADAFAETMAGQQTPIALIQDYHFALLPEQIRERTPGAFITLFWHIPWPNMERIQICPWKQEILNGLLAADLIGFQTQEHCEDFLACAARFAGAKIDSKRQSVWINGHQCKVQAFPISIAWPQEVSFASVAQTRKQIHRSLEIPARTKIGLGVDRLDYIKGIPEKFLAVERFLERHPEWVGRFVLVQVSAPTRTQIARYQELGKQVTALKKRINRKFRKGSYVPIVHRFSHHAMDEVFEYYRSADVCLVTSLHDGMNLVAKEFVASRSDFGGTLVLSSFAGAAHELRDAFLVNPYDTDECAEAIHEALTLPPLEGAERMRRMRSVVKRSNVYAWAGHFLSEIETISEQKKHPWKTAVR